MKIGIVCYPTYGGSGVIATELGKALADKGYTVHFITYKQPFRLDSFHENIFFHEVNFTNYPLFEYPPYEIALSSKIVDVAINEKLDLLHVHYAIPHASAAYLAKQILKERNYHLPFITTLHGTDITLVGKDETFVPVVTFSINQSDGITSVSDSLKQDTYANFDIKKDIAVIPNFIDFTRFKKLNKEHFRKVIAKNGERIVVHTSNFRKVKRVEDVVKVFCQIKAAVPSKLLLVGDGPERQNVEKLARQVCNEDDVYFLGKQEAVEELLAIADLFILPSETESFGLAALEAMACEVPVISTNTGGIPEINIHGVTGFMSAVGDVDDMAKNAIHILSDDQTLAQFRANAITQAKVFSLENILPQYESYYRKIVESSK
ncbi:MAG TPA: N-acetyl-alpha-D-glucosaminyl L-malate synthase BshA [Chitinophagales bacterium]|nr:N-acetyl-alpha-D-glucosaminyl L-malate synthase BshA [Chitinophagales bacterium]